MKIFLTVLLVLLLLLVGLWFLRVGGRAVYSEAGILLQVKIGAFYWTLYPRKKPKKKKKSEKKPKEKKEPKPEESDLRKLVRKAGSLLKKSQGFWESETGGDLRALLDTLPELFDLLGETVRKLRVEELYLNYTIAGRNNPAEAAILYGSVCATGGAVSGILREKMDIRKENTQAVVDFSAVKSTVYVRLTLSYTIGQVVRIAIHALRYFVKVKSMGKQNKAQK